MIKRKFFFILLFLFSFNIFAFSNRISAGFSLYLDNENIDSENVSKYILTDFSYEFLFSPVRFCNLSTEVIFETNPFINNYLLSLNLKGYLKDDFSGFFIGFSPISKINFGNLFSDKEYLNYGIGFSLGFNKKINNRLHFETEGIITFCLYDKTNKMKVDISTCVKYLLF